MDRKRILITGVSGLLGNNLAHYFKDKYEILGLYCAHPVSIKGIQTQRVNILSEADLRNVVQDFKPQVLIHSASMTNVDQCEINKELARKVNLLGTRVIVESANGDNSIKLIYISTDSVYDGSKGYFSETDKIKPLNYYGLSKYEGELECLKRSNSLILRTNIFGWNIQDKKSLGEWILGELKEKREIKCFKDAYFSSIYTLELARTIDIAIKKNLSGIYNCGSSDSCSKYEFAVKIADCFGFNNKLITSISIDDFNFNAKRGKRLSLNVDKFQKKLDYKLPSIAQSIEVFYRDYKCGLSNEIKQNQFNAQEKSVFIPYGKQWIDENDIQSVVRVLRSERITQGPKIEEFEMILSERCGAKYAVAVSSGTAALHLACLAAGIEEEDEVITSPISFVGSANCVLYCGGRPVFADIREDTCNINPVKIRNEISSKTKAIIPVHFTGLPCDMEAIKKIAEKRRLVVIEDACHALGAEFLGSDRKWHKVGSCSHSDMAVFSFHPVKHITTGEGGAIMTNKSELYEKLVLLRSHGITKDSSKFTNLQSAPPWYYEMQELGFNYRITDIQCALGLSQLKKLGLFVEKRRLIAAMYDKAFKDIKNVKTPIEPKAGKSAYHLYVVQIDFEKIGKNRSSVMNELMEKGIGTQVHFIPIHLQPYFRRSFGFQLGNFPLAESYYEQCLTLPLYPMMTNENVEQVINEVTNLAGNK